MHASLHGFGTYLYKLRGMESELFGIKYIEMKSSARQSELMWTTLVQSRWNGVEAFWQQRT